MYKQLEYLREGITMTRGQTYQLDLPESGLLSGLFFKLSAPCASGATLADAKWRLQDHLTTVEIIANGATVIKSLDFKNLDFLNWLKSGVSPLHSWRNYATNTQFEYLLMHFGRFYGDPEYGLDLSKYDNVELKFTNSSSSTYHGSDITASILQLYMRDQPGGFQGHIRSEKWREWTTVSDETKYFTLPSEYPICGLFLRALPSATSGVADTGFANQMNDVDFSIEGGIKRVYKGGIDDLALMNYYERGAEVFVGGHIDVNADRGVDVGLGRIQGWAWGSGSKDGAVSSTIPTLEADLTNNTIKPEAREADSPIHFLLHGYGYQNHVWLHYSPLLEPGTLLDPAEVGDILLDIHTRSGSTYADGTNQVILERVVV